jgi:RND family efflux transporter MFP subunit
MIWRRASARTRELFGQLPIEEVGTRAGERLAALGAALRRAPAEVQLLLLVVAAAAVFVLYVLLPTFWSPNSRAYSSLGYPALMRVLHRPIPVQVELVQKRPMPRTIAAEGTTAYLNETQVHSEVPGIVTEILVDAGHGVQSGDVLLYVNPGGHTTRMFTLRRQLRQRELEQARVRLERERSLYQRKLISKDEFEDAQIDLRRAETASNLAMEEYAHSLRSRSATVTGEPLPWTGVELATQRVEIVATVAGTVIQRDVHVGENLIDLRNPLMVIGDRLVFQAHVDQRYAGLLQPGDRGRLHLRAHPGREIPTTVIRLDHQVEAVPQRGSNKSGPPPFTFSVWMSIPDSLRAQGKLLPGMTGYTVFEDTDTTLALPERALIRYSGRTGTVFTVDSGKRLELKRVTYTGSENGWVALESDNLPEGAAVVVSGQSALKAGDQVRLRPRLRTAPLKPT